MGFFPMSQLAAFQTFPPSLSLAHTSFFIHCLSFLRIFRFRCCPSRCWSRHSLWAAITHQLSLPEWLQLSCDNFHRFVYLVTRNSVSPCFVSVLCSSWPSYRSLLEERVSIVRQCAFEFELLPRRRHKYRWDAGGRVQKVGIAGVGYINKRMRRGGAFDDSYIRHARKPTP